MKVRATLLIGVLIVAGALALHRLHLHRARLTVSPLLGCYELKHGRWWPWDSAGPGSFTELPEKLELTDLPSPDVLDEGALLARPRSLVKTSRPEHPLVFYWQVDEGQVIVTSTNHLAGVTIRMQEGGKHLSGRARTHTDADMFRLDFMRVTAERIACQEPQKTP